ncbi:hypothetical protein K469DRAFT_799534 [Zopfia rhizophila CBS 207.26]|uniref:Uncharacterized protein n=1 Tax=Zopfia rhizophila CBS 207.26 TaxID=1314779 RepID=A0A6A6DID4_9PEZI|nr:hypothetical protein K469DRAFT_799534 [Zopfia rhizophila CBS 207.26]
MFHPGEYSIGILNPVGAAWGFIMFGTLGVAVGIFCCCIPTLPPVLRRWWDEWWSPGMGSKVMRRFCCRSSTSNLNEQTWAGGSVGGSNAFVALEDNSSERSGTSVLMT